MFSLRYYQEEAIDAAQREWDDHQATAIVAATGTGKTEIYLALAVSEPGRVIVMAHRDYLLSQPIARLAAHGFDDVAVEKAEQRSESLGQRKNKVVFASVQSLCKPNRLSTFDPLDFSLLIIDEGHRAVATTYRRVIDYFSQGNPRLRVLVMTATPKRKDNVALGNLCGGDISVAYTYGPKKAADEGWIVPLRFFRREVHGLDFSTVKMRGSDLDQEQIEHLLLKEEPLHRVCASLADDAGPTIVFCPGVAAARTYCELMNQRYRRNRAAVLWADSTDEEREIAGKRLSGGDLDFIFNVDLFTEGFDVPELTRVVWAAPTASLVRFTQGTGRVFRTHSSLRGQLTGGREQSEERRLLISHSPKQCGHVVTYYPQNCKHQLCEPNDILGGDDLPAEIREAAKAIQEATASQEGGSDPDEDIETAEAFVALRSLLDQRLKHVAAKAAARDVEYDAMGGSRNRLSGADASDVRRAVRTVSTDWPSGEMASPKQIGWLKYNGVPNARELKITKWRACVLRSLIEGAKVSPEFALSCSKKQALAVLAKAAKASAT